mgnify:CR=1 FL=1
MIRYLLTKLSRVLKERLDRPVSSVDLVDLARAEGVELTDAGGGWIGLCPFHKALAPSFHVSLDRTLYHCFSCGAHGNAYAFIERSRRCQAEEAVRHVRRWRREQQ